MRMLSKSALVQNPVGRIIEGERVIKALGSDIAIDQGTYIFNLVRPLVT